MQSDLYTSRHAGLAVKIRSALTTRHPVTGHIIGERPSVWANFGEPTGEVHYKNPLTGEDDTLETYMGGTFSLQVAAEENGWDEDVQDMVRRTLDKMCVDRPAMIQRVDYVVPPAEKPWPTFDAATDVDEIAAMAKTLGLVGKTLAYERENLGRAALIQLLEGAESIDPEPEPEPVVAVKPKKAEDKLERVIVA